MEEEAGFPQSLKQTKKHLKNKLGLMERRLFMGWQMKMFKVSGRNSEATHGVQSVRACNHLE